jgi:two-component system, OmpR family, sensor kinase
MFKSIRGTLLFWYACVLLLVIAGFGAALYYRLEQSMNEELNARLHVRLQAVATSLASRSEERVELRPNRHFLQYFKAPPGTPPAKPPRRRELGERDEFEEHAGPGQTTNNDAAGAARDEAVESGDAYYVIWDGRGRIVGQSDPDLKVSRPEALRDPRTPLYRDREEYRETAVAGPRGALVLVGMDTSGMRKRLRDFLAVMLASGTAAAAVALAGGWLITGRAMAPLGRMSATASAISASNLSERIDVAHAKSELGQLAAVLNAAFDRLEAAFQQQARFTADASHELRTPLSIVMSHAELALRRERTVKDYRETIETCLRAAGRMKTVVEGLLTLARADAGEARIRREPTGLDAIVSETVALLAPLAKEKNVTVEVAAEPTEVLGDPDRLREVVGNLLGNALQYNRPAGTVHIALGPEAGEAVLTVADTGIGIPESDLPHVFERFYRVDKARSRQHGGNGLGLAIAKWVVEAHGGSITCTSREGVGTTFAVRLPRHTGDAGVDA